VVYSNSLNSGTNSILLHSGEQYGRTYGIYLYSTAARHVLLCDAVSPTEVINFLKDFPRYHTKSCIDREHMITAPSMHKNPELALVLETIYSTEHTKTRE